MDENLKDRAVVVCTNVRGVFFGWLADTNLAPVYLRAARNCYYWAAPMDGGGQRGIMSLASHGPHPGSRVGPPADIALVGVSCIIACTPEAVERWNLATWEEPRNPQAEEEKAQRESYRNREIAKRAR